MRKLLAGFATSIDGFIRGPQGELDWIVYDHEQFRELEKQWAETDAMFHGRVTYEEAMRMQEGKRKKAANPFAHMKHYVFSTTLSSVAEGFTLVCGNIVEEVRRIKSEPGKNIAVFGGASLLSSLLRYGLVDELVLAICPVILGAGTPFFSNIDRRLNYVLRESRSYPSGLVQLTYVTK
ncbi:MAG TPA: dihydrofolate reductase family protein [Chitinophagaceae bacterium]|nr:dihydrofolate reductase family protein [Chitinophagaceae bacterium]